MIPPEILHRKSLFSLLHKIDFEMAEQARARGCPTVGDRCTMPTTRENQKAVLLIWMRYLRFAIACAVVVKDAGAVFSHHRFGFGSAGYTGHQCFLSPLLFDKEKIRTAPLCNSKAFSVYGVPPSTVGGHYFRELFPQSLAYRRLAGYLIPPIHSGHLPKALLDRFESATKGPEEALVNCLRVLALGP